jgi:hypothetical protein
MARVKRGIMTHKRHKSNLRDARGFVGGRHRLYKTAKETLMRAERYAYRDRRVRKRDVSFGPRTPDGAKAWDTFMTLTATAKKLGVSIYRYIHDRVSDTYELPALADLITQRASQQPLGASWDPA